MSRIFRLLRSRWSASLAALSVLCGVLVVLSPSANADVVDVSKSSVMGSDGTLYSVTNHLVTSALNGLSGGTTTGTSQSPHEWLVVWAGDQNAADNTSLPINAPLQVSSPQLTSVQGALPGPDFLAVIDADRSSPNYGKVVNTATVGPLVENEPHHMQYVWHKGNKLYAGGLYSAATYVFDVTKLPALSMSGVSLPVDTPCGSVPDAFAVLKDGTAYGTYMGGPVLPGPCAYTNGDVRVGNGFAGTPGEVVHFGSDGKVLSETAASVPTSEDPSRCADIPTLLVASCANPHGIQVREDLNRMITVDYAEPRDIILDPVKAPSPDIYRPTVRLWDISNRNAPKLTSVSKLPDGPRKESNPLAEENAAGMEPAVTNLPNHRGAFAETFCGGAIYYTPDMTAPNPVWREVFDDTAAARRINPNANPSGGCDGGGWIGTSPDDHYLYHTVIGRSASGSDPGFTKMVYTLDISKLVAGGTNTTCSIDTLAEVSGGGAEPDCPTVASVLPVDDTTTGGPHFGSLDNFAMGSDGYFHETTDIRRMAFSDYFVGRTGIDGNHQVCMVNVDNGHLSLDSTFRDEYTGTPCVSFNRTHWPHGDFGPAKPHLALFVVNDAGLR